MQELIKIQKNESDQEVVSAKELHAFLEVKAVLPTWVKRMFEYGFEEGKDFVPILEESTGGRPSVDYALTLDCAKEIAMIQRSEKGKQARQYFIEAEKQLRKKELPQTYSQALRQLLSEVEQKEQALLQVENLSTALDILHDWVSIIKVATHNKVPETVFNWRALKAQSEAMGFEIKKAASPRFGYQNLYHVSVFKACYPQFRYDLNSLMRN